MTVKITLKPSGPILVQGGEVQLVDHEGNPITPPPAKTPGTIKLCTCHRSAIHPFCDGTHNKPAAT
jgi:CDGSH-type Zn-finger protein